MRNEIENNKAEEFLRFFRKGEEFTLKLMKENEKLRYKIVSLKENTPNNTESVPFSSNAEMELKTLHEENEKLIQDKANLISKIEKVEEENEDFANKYIEIEEENNKLANLYISSYQLHSTLDFNEVIRTVVEIIINLIGGEKFLVMLFKDNSSDLITVASEGIENTVRKIVRPGEGIIGKVALSGETYYADDLTEIIEDENYDYPIVCIPLKIQEHIIGVIALYSLLCQKEKKLTDIDYELFSMLAAHAATAICGAKLYSQSERKLTTIQGFLELLSGSNK